jgi:hypothetical protein
MKRAVFGLLLILGCSSFASAQQYTYYFPQVASGFYSGGAWRTTVFISNSTGTTANGVITFTASDGSPFNLTLVDEAGNPVGGGNQVGFQLAPGETRKVQSTGAEPLNTGYATVTATAAVLGTAMFTKLDAAGRIVSEAGVPAGIPLGKQAIFVDTVSGFRTGVAIANPNTNPLHITFQLVNTAGQVIASVTRDVPTFQHISFFIDELFPGAPPMVGRLQFWCVNPMVSVGLRFDPTQSFFTTLPPIALAN